MSQLYKSFVFSLIMIGYFVGCFAVLYTVGWATVYYAINGGWTTLAIALLIVVMAGLPFTPAVKCIWDKWVE